MIDGPDIVRAPQLLLKYHGAGAPVAAAQRATELLAQGDLEGHAIWRRIERAVEELARTEPITGERLN